LVLEETVVLEEVPEEITEASLIFLDFQLAVAVAVEQDGLASAQDQVEDVVEGQPQVATVLHKVEAVQIKGLKAETQTPLLTQVAVAEVWEVLVEIPA
jgi:hypothetical protein